MRELLQQYASYNLWANQRLADAVLSVPAQAWDTIIVSSFNSLRLTFTHLWNAEHIWYQRFQLQDANNTIPPLANKDMTMPEIVAGLLNQSGKWFDWVKANSGEVFESEFTYRNSANEPFQQPAFQVLLHLFNHSTYHRGQIVTMLRQLNVYNIPATDFIVFSRSKQKNAAIEL